MDTIIYWTIALIIIIIIFLLYLSLWNNDTPANSFDWRYAHLLIKFSWIWTWDKEWNSSMWKQEITEFIWASSIIHQAMHKKILDDKIISNPFMALLKEKIMWWSYSLVWYKLYFIYNWDKITVYASVPEFALDAFSAAIMSATEGSHIERIKDEDMFNSVKKVTDNAESIVLRLIPQSPSYNDTFKDYEEISGFPSTVILTNLLKCKNPTLIEYNIVPIPSNYIRHQVMKKSRADANKKKGFLQTESQQQWATQRKSDEEGAKRASWVFFKLYIDIVWSQQDAETCASSYSLFEKGFSKFNKTKLPLKKPY